MLDDFLCEIGCEEFEDEYEMREEYLNGEYLTSD